MKNVSESSDFYRSAEPQLFEFSDASIAVRKFGNGPALLLIHGFPLHGATWRKILPSLSEKYSCYVVDLPGLGDSHWSEETDFSFPAHAARLSRLLDLLNIDRCHVIAQNTGATIARCLALLEKERVRSLILINTELPNHRPPWIPLHQQLLRLPGAVLNFRILLRLPLFLRSSMAFGGSFCDLDSIQGEFHRLFIRPLIKSQNKASGMVSYLKGVSWQIVDGMAYWHQAMTMPVRLVWGELDPTFPISRAAKLREQFPNCDAIVAIQNSKLLPHEERPDQTLAAIQPFLEKHAR
mgnify:CR=1 FL=1